MPHDSKRRRIGVDVDDVLADFVTAHAAIAREMFGRPEPGVEPVDWAMSNYGLTKEQHSAVWKKLQNTKNFWLMLGKKAGTSQLPELHKYNHVYYITSRVPSTGLPLEVQTAKWIHQNYGIEYPPVILTGGLNKGEVAKALELHAFIDDREENCMEVYRFWPDCKVYLCSRSHNLKFRHSYIERVASLNDFVEFL